MSIGLALRPAMQRIKNVVQAFYWRLRCNEEGIRVASRVSLRNVACESYVNIAHDAELLNVKLGRRTSIGRYTKIRSAILGSYCSISWDVTIGAVAHPMDRPSSHAFTYRSQFGVVEQDESLENEDMVVSIGNDVWIGCGAIVMPGVTIGDGAVVGAGAVVTKDVGSYSIVSGIPAKFMRYRFDRELIDQLESLRWWDWDDEVLKARISFFKSPLNEESISRLLKEKN